MAGARPRHLGRPLLTLPTFVIVGAQKCGTSSLAAWLRDHPQVYFAERKELHFFSNDENWARGLDWYADHFANAGDATAIGEATPHYMNFPEAIDRLGAVLPDAKLIVCLRDPVERTYSSYRHLFYRRAGEDRPFRRAIEDELRERSGLPEPGHCHHLQLRYLVQGRYLEQIELLLARFPRSALHVMLLDDMEADPKQAFAGVCRFLGIDPAFEPPAGWAVENAHRVVRPVALWRFMQRHGLFERLPQPAAKFVALRVFRRDAAAADPIDPDLRARMVEYFAEPNAALAQWLGRDLSAWNAGASAFALR
jgi:hypothetical protein